MSWTVEGVAANSGASGTTAEFSGSAHGRTITDGDLVIVCVHTNNDGATIADTTGSGAAFTAEVDSYSDMAGKTATFAVFWKIAASEPANYTFSHGGNARWSISICVVTPDSGTPAIDVSALHHIEASATNVGVAKSITTAANSFGFAFYGNDNTGIPGSHTADNGYTAPSDGDAGNQTQLIAYQVDDAGGATGDITAGAFTDSDKTYSAHMSWVHAAGGGGGRIMSSLTDKGGLAGIGGIAGIGGGLAG